MSLRKNDHSNLTLWGENDEKKINFLFKSFMLFNSGYDSFSQLWWWRRFKWRWRHTYWKLRRVYWQLSSRYRMPWQLCSRFLVFSFPNRAKPLCSWQQETKRPVHVYYYYYPWGWWVCRWRSILGKNKPLLKIAPRSLAPLAPWGFFNIIPSSWNTCRFHAGLVGGEGRWSLRL